LIAISICLALNAHGFSCLMQELEKSKPVILTGDLNCAHEEIDIYNPAVSDLDFHVVYESLV
jgi:exonuclease III